MREKKRQRRGPHGSRTLDDGKDVPPGRWRIRWCLFPVFLLLCLVLGVGITFSSDWRPSRPWTRVWTRTTPKKIAFMFLAKGPLPLFRLWEKFLDGHDGLHTVYIHSWPSFDADYPPASPFYRRQIPSLVTEWGRMSLCDAERLLLANALLDISNEWFVLLSESCIPVHNFGTVYDYFLRSRYSFVQAFDGSARSERGRYVRRMYPNINITNWRKGSQWFQVNRKLAVFIVRDIKYHRIFEEFCSRKCYADEHYFPTMLSMEAPHLLANRSVTYVDWSRPGPHPATFDGKNVNRSFLEKIIGYDNKCDYNGQQTSICFLFARKFTPNTLQRLLELAPKLFGYG